MPWYRRLAWAFYPRILVLGMGRFEAGGAFLAWMTLGALLQVDGEPFIRKLTMDGFHHGTKLIQVAVHRGPSPPPQAP